MGRPLGVTILAILQILGGIFLVLGGQGMVLLFPGILGTVLGGFFLILGIIGIIIGWGLWTLKSWAWMWAMIINILSIIINIVTQNWIGIIIPLIIVLYLNQPTIKSKFK